MERINQAVLAIKSTQPNSVEFKRDAGVTMFHTFLQEPKKEL